MFVLIGPIRPHKSHLYTAGGCSPHSRHSQQSRRSTLNFRAAGTANEHMDVVCANPFKGIRSETQ
jgi:hypothetical protein